MSETLCWRVDMACRAAWPSARAANIGGWQARQSGGPIRRVNSLNPLPGCQPPDAALLNATAAWYSDFGQSTLVRLPDFLPADENVFARAGFAPEGATLTLHADLARLAGHAAPVPAINRDLTAAPSADWLAARDRIGGSDGERFAKMLTMIHNPAGFACVRVDGEIASLAYGVIHDRMLIIESVITDEAHRGQGLARQVVSGLIGWAVSQGVTDAALQVVADNEPARALYRRLGFGNHLYGYRYMRRP